MAFCVPCADRGRKNIPAEREIGGTPMCESCIGGGKGGAPGFPPPRFERVPALASPRAWERFFRELSSLRENEDLAAHPYPGQTLHALRESIRRNAKARGIEVRFRVVEGVVRVHLLQSEATC